ncbi:hypothetical protein N657DRAFT_278221 [Parathielavia appendiculata]|uniref:Uncharacterized protein n=1 Tax=Parathielavia appendiculata TaxID=2587402 RepID=A0AAN6U3I2_9PEZI|nr:hypothetical protein N657DRAFT_278221 [Parathielavia appendiculata]
MTQSWPEEPNWFLSWMGVLRLHDTVSENVRVDAAGACGLWEFVGGTSNEGGAALPLRAGIQRDGFLRQPSLCCTPLLRQCQLRRSHQGTRRMRR